MNKLRRFLYLGYYLVESDWRKVIAFTSYAAQRTGLSRLRILGDALVSSIRYNVSILDYFHFRFYECGSETRGTYAGTGFMYEYQLEMNPRNARSVLNNKIEFLEIFKPFVRRRFASLADLRSNPDIATALLENRSAKLVLKGATGQVGAEVEVVNCIDFDNVSLLRYMKERGYDLVEEFVQQHDDLMRLSEAGLNTVRIFTQLHQGKLEYLGARLRVTVNSSVDNMAAGNLAAPVDIPTGIVSGPGVYSDIRKAPVTHHPVSGAALAGFQIPFWKETLALLERAVFVVPENRSVGWDIAISNEGPELIEGNHNWCKLLWQLPVGKGLKPHLERFR